MEQIAGVSVAGLADDEDVFEGVDLINADLEMVENSACQRPSPTMRERNMHEYWVVNLAFDLIFL